MAAKVISTGCLIAMVSLLIIRGDFAQAAGSDVETQNRAIILKRFSDYEALASEGARDKELLGFFSSRVQSELLEMLVGSSTDAELLETRRFIANRLHFLEDVKCVFDINVVSDNEVGKYLLVLRSLTRSKNKKLAIKLTFENEKASWRISNTTFDFTHNAVINVNESQCKKISEAVSTPTRNGD